MTISTAKHLILFHCCTQYNLDHPNDGHRDNFVAGDKVFSVVRKYQNFWFRLWDGFLYYLVPFVKSEKTKALTILSGRLLDRVHSQNTILSALELTPDKVNAQAKKMFSFLVSYLSRSVAWDEDLQNFFIGRTLSQFDQKQNPNPVWQNQPIGTERTLLESLYKG